MRRAAFLVAMVIAACVAGALAVLAWRALRLDLEFAGEPAPREMAVVIDPELSDDHAWRVGRNPPGSIVNRWIDLEADVLEDGRLHVVRRLRRPDYEYVTEFSLDLANTEGPTVAVQAWTREQKTGTAWHVHDLEGTVRVSSARPSAEPATGPLVVEYELHGWQSGSDQRLHGKFALDLPVERK
jgi:hypothetical protein